MAARPLEVISTLDALSGSLRRRLLEGELAPGTPLGEVDLAAEYGVARPTARAAIQALVAEGLLRREPNRSARVPELTADDVRDLFYVREALELQAVDTLTERHERPPAAEEAVRRLEALPRRAPWDEVVEADMDFHTALVAAAGSPRMERVYDTLQSEIRLCMVQLKPSYDDAAKVAAEHRELLEAIANGPKRSALKLMSEHLAMAVRDLTQASRRPARPRTAAPQARSR
jgi:DNA-binding GntR family transcriptional regulator